MPHRNGGCLSLGRHAAVDGIKNNGPENAGAGKFSHGGSPQQGSLGSRPSREHPMKLATELYLEQAKSWPKAGRHILAHYDEESILVYQAYRPSIGRSAVEQGCLGGGGFSYSRMSWIKPNFLWMMYRSGWGTREGQEVTLALRVRRAFFEELLARSVPSTYHEGEFATREQWQEAVAGSSVRLQWDPDHDPSGAKLERRAVQLGLRDGALEAFGKRELLEVADLSGFVAEQRLNTNGKRLSQLRTPVERVYVPADPAICVRLGLADFVPRSE
jgi:hypothetical protein